MARPRLSSWLAAFACATAILALPGCDDKDLERTLGKEAAESIESEYKLVDDPLVTSYVNTMGHMLVGHSQRQDIPYEFKIIDTQVVNAAAAPYGHIYLTSGLLAFVDSEDELWAVTGHEIGHEVTQDSLKQVKESMLLSIASAIIGRESKVGGQIAELGFNLLSLKHSRDDEYAADDHGTQVTLAAGHDPRAQMAFFERLMTEVEKDHPWRLDTFFMTHPPTVARIKRQAENPAASVSDPDTLAQVAAGYARRARYAEAIVRLQDALHQRPDMASARLLLADCYLARGDRQQAATEYASVLKADPTLVPAQDGLRAAGKEPAPTPVAVASQAEVAAVAAETDRAARDVEAATARVTSLIAKLPRDLKPAGTDVKASTDLLVALAQSGIQLPPAGTQVAVEAAAAVGETNESVCTVEQIGEVMRVVVDGLAHTVEVVRGASRAGLGSQDALALARSARETSRAAQELTALSGELPALIKGVQGAGRVAHTAVDRLAQAFSPGATLADRQIAGDSVKLTRQRGGKAREAARRAADRAALARTRALVAEINARAVLLGGRRCSAGDRLVAYYTQSDADTVRRLREDSHLGLGEAALVLASAASSQRPPEAVLAAAGPNVEVVEAARTSGARLRHVNLFLKFVADALIQESALQ